MPRCVEATTRARAQPSALIPGRRGFEIDTIWPRQVGLLYHRYKNLHMKLLKITVSRVPDFYSFATIIADLSVSSIIHLRNLFSLHTLFKDRLLT